MFSFFFSCPNKSHLPNNSKTLNKSESFHGFTRVTVVAKSWKIRYFVWKIGSKKYFVDL